MIRIKGLDKYYNKGKSNEIHVIDGVSLELPERGMTAIFGRSGCGKTTLLNIIGGLDGYDGGSVEIENTDIRKNTDDIRNRDIGYIFQNYCLNNEESCFDNVANALKLCGITDETVIEKRVMTALENVGMAMYRSRTPDTLSGGQQQRIAIARAIVKNPRIVLADEPTGNLDEANTLVIMELLEQIAREHAVLLVTHETNLVDYYCDTVIELSDGKTVNVRRNDKAHGYTARDKNDIFLGELDKSEISNDSVVVEYYGDKPKEPVRLQVVNSNGKLMVRINTPKVNVLDEFSEIKLRDGVFVQSAESPIRESIDMSELPPVHGERFGRLFTFRSAVKSGYRSNFAKSKKGKKFLRVCLALFAAVFVLVSAFFGTAFSDMIKIDKAYNHNVFYVYTPTADVSEMLRESVGDDAGIDYLRVNGVNVPSGDTRISFISDNFETFSMGYYGTEDLYANAVFLDSSLCGDLPLVVGRSTELKDSELVITTAVADALLTVSPFGYIKEYRDLIGLITPAVSIDGKNLKCVGVVRSDETAVYMSELAAAKYAISATSTYAYRAAERDVQVGAGQTQLIVIYKRNDIPCPSAGGRVHINGVELEVSSVQRLDGGYDKWLDSAGVELDKESEYFGKLAVAADPECEIGSDEYNALVDEYRNEKYYDYVEYRYGARFDEYLKLRNTFDADFYTWLAVEKNALSARIMCMQAATSDVSYVDYYWAVRFKKENGRFPTLAERDACTDRFDEYETELYDYIQAYEEEFYRTRYNSYYSDVVYLLNDTDFIAVSKSVGATHKSANAYFYWYAMDDVSVGDIPFGGYYTVLHSDNPERTKAYLSERFSGSDADDEHPAVITPDAVRDGLAAEMGAGITKNIITLIVVLGLMCVCMYFIMRSALFVRIKEIGIYRAIGVSKKNMIYKFAIEASVLTVLTVFIGYLLMSLFVALLCKSPVMSSVLYYPIWVALPVLIILFAVSLLCGLLPILMLLGKSPSEILAKYDI